MGSSMNSDVLVSDVNGFYRLNDDVKKVEKKSSKEKNSKILKTLVIALVVMIVLEVLVYAVLMPCLAPVRVVYTGLETFTPQQVNNYLKISPKTTWIGFNSSAAAASLTSNAVIENVVIEKRFPDQVRINVTERKAVAVTLANVRGKTVPVQIDKNGVIFAVDRGLPKENVPLVTGFTFETISEGMRLNAKLRPLMDQISQIYAKNPAYFTMLSEIRVVANEYGSYELELYPAEEHIKVLVDRTLSDETLQYMMVVLDVLSSINADVSEVDLRYGSVSYR